MRLLEIFKRKQLVTENGAMDEALRVLIRPLLDDLMREAGKKVDLILKNVSPYREEIKWRDERIEAQHSVLEKLVASFDLVRDDYNKAHKKFEKTKKNLDFYKYETIRLRRIRWSEYEKEVKKYRRILNDKSRMRKELNVLTLEVEEKKDTLVGNVKLVDTIAKKLKLQVDANKILADDLNRVIIERNDFKKKLVNTMAHNEMLLEKVKTLSKQKMDALDAKRTAQFELRQLRDPFTTIGTPEAATELVLPGDDGE